MPRAARFPYDCVCQPGFHPLMCNVFNKSKTGRQEKVVTCVTFYLGAPIIRHTEYDVLQLPLPLQHVINALLLWCSVDVRDVDLGRLSATVDPCVGLLVFLGFPRRGVPDSQAGGSQVETVLHGAGMTD